MKKQFFILNTAIILGLSSVAAIPNVSAENLNDMKSKKTQIQEKRSGVESSIHNADEEIQVLQGEQEKLSAQLKTLDLAIGDTNTKIREKNEQITEINAEIKKLETEINELKIRIEKRNVLLKDRAVSLQESGGSVNYLEVVLGASSFGDFVDRVSAVATFVEADQKILKEHEDDKKALETKQAEVKDKLAKLESMKAQLEKMMAELTTKKQQKDVVLAQLKTKEAEVEHEKVSLEEEADILAGQEKAIQQAIALEQKRLEEVEAARLKAIREAKKKKATSSSSSNRSESSYASAPPVSSGMFTRPSAGRVTSKMGARWNKMHAGIDIAQSGTVPVVAAASGVVIKSYYSSSYGNCIMISHSINGEIYTTVYAHLDSRDVSSGQTVSKGQQLGYMGNTGRSFGQHLHFELHKGSWNGSKSNAVNPLSYISM